MEFNFKNPVRFSKYLPLILIVMVFFENGKVYSGDQTEFDWTKINRFKVLKIADGWEL